MTDVEEREAIAEVQIKHAQYKYNIPGTAVNTKTGETIERRVPRIAKKDQIVELFYEDDLKRGEALGAFYTDEDYDDGSEGDDADADDEESGDPPEDNDHEALVTWIRDEKPKASRVVEEAGDDKERAQALLAAENEASGGDPRKSVVEPLNKIIEG